MDFQSYAVTETDAGSDLANLRTTAILSTSTPQHYVLNGSKQWIGNCEPASWYFVLARTDPKAKANSAFTGFVVERGMEGVEIGAKVWFTLIFSQKIFFP